MKNLEIIVRKTSSMPIDGPLMAIDGPHGTAMAIDELRWDLSTGMVRDTKFSLGLRKRRKHLLD